MQPALTWQEKAAALRQAFTPATPVRNAELFAGRQDQMVRIVDTFHTLGEHAMIFGERGVGKTSLATVSEQMANLAGQFGVRVNCQASDDMSAIWRRVGEAIQRTMIVDQSKAHRFDDLVGVAEGAVTLLTGPTPDTHAALTALQILAQVRPVVVFLDEFDRVGEATVETELVDLMKMISDQGFPMTFVIVGVAADVDALITEHESIGRGLNEVEMPRMSIPELRDIIDRGLRQAEMTAAADASDFIAQLSTGLPHYAHLMGLHAALTAVHHESEVLTVEHALESLPTSVARAQQHVSRLYFDATHSTQANLFKQVLLAAALTPTDERGYFAPGDLRVPMAAILGHAVEIPSFAKHLVQFADARGPVLDRTGVTTRPRYRFTEPLLVPYVSMRGVEEGTITPALMRKLLSGKGSR